ncbi:hypothetical protein [Nocardia brasiliensis]|uniref:hypothetical protein n=1 Tax=Nocardia brasiliensis TaxID=37326 RepID=UPI0024575EB2|nr:hypothetical protein [Nocardia brasiliensis]
MYRSSLNALTVLLCGLLTVSLAGAGSAAPFVSSDGGLRRCVFDVANLDGATGSPRSPAALRDAYTVARPTDWCSMNTGTASIDFTAEGLQLMIPPTMESNLADQLQLAPVIGNNAEVLPYDTFAPGMTLATTAKVPQGYLNNGTAGWGLANRVADISQLEVAWFAWWGTDGPVSKALAPLESLVAQPTFGDYPRSGFFIMVKRSGEQGVRMQRLDPHLLDGLHSYGIRLSH